MPPQKNVFVCRKRKLQAEETHETLLTMSIVFTLFIGHLIYLLDIWIDKN